MTPYTARGISRVPCVRCRAPSRYQWTCCSLGNAFFGCCARCDVLLNRMVLRFMRYPRRTAAAIIRRYEQATRE